MTIAVVEGGRVTYSRAFGFRDVEKRLPATPSTVYGVGSVTKSFTALAIMQLVERGLLSLDDPVDKYLPIKLRPLGERVTVEHLLSHTSGIPALGYAEALIAGTIGEGDVWMPLAKPEDIVAFMSRAQEWAVARPGGRFFYLNEGYVLLGLLISRVAGMRYEDYVRGEILEPLGMKRSYFRREEAEADPELATPYLLEEGDLHPTRFPYGITSDGGLLSNVLDLARYLALYLGRGEAGGIRLVSRSSIEEMERPRASVPWQVLGGEGYGLGWVIAPNFYGRKLVHHSGSVLVYTAFVGYVPDAGVGVAVLANASGYPLSRVGMYALALAMGEDPRKLPFTALEEAFRRVEGVYEAYRGTVKVKVEAEGDILYLEFLGRGLRRRLPLFPEAVSEEAALFYTMSGGARISAEFKLSDRVELIYERYRFIKRA
ncbi:MAG: serine hydrolase [Thermoprotei archaeon]|nr:MAG: serine hydrolase [Thermoprotei archaeon]